MVKKKEIERVEQSVKDAETFDNPDDLMPIPDRLKQDSPHASLNEAEKASGAKKAIFPLTKGNKYRRF